MHAHKGAYVNAEARPRDCSVSRGGSGGHGYSGRRGPPGVHDAQRPRRRSGRHHGLFAKRDRPGRELRGAITRAATSARDSGFSRPRGREEVEGPGDDRPGRVLQGRTGPSSSHTIGPMRITYDFYQRCTKLPAGPAREGNGHQGPSVRQPERDGQGARHRAGRARRSGRQGAGDRRARIPRRSGLEPRPDLPGEARRQDLQCSR